MDKKISILAGGELILSMAENPTYYFEPLKPLFDEADFVFCHLEAPHTDRPIYQGRYVAPAAPMKNIIGVKYAGIDLLTLAANPTSSFGPYGVEDTIKWLDENDIAYCGGGMTIDDARRPAIKEVKGVKLGFLSYDCTSARSPAGYKKPGAAYVDVLTYYPPTSFPGEKPRAALTFLEPWSLQAMKDDIMDLRPQCDVLFVAIHKGLGFSAEIADYEYDITREAIEAGADVIIGNHSHVIKPVEFYKDGVIFHSTSNLVTVFPWQVHSMFHIEPASTLTKSKLRPQRTGYAKALCDLDNAPNYPFPQKECLIGKLIVDAHSKKIVEVRMIPIYVNNEGQPIPVGRSENGQKVVDIMEQLTSTNDFGTKYTWEGDEVVVTPA